MSSNYTNQFSKLSKSSKSIEYQTPLDFFHKLNSIFNFELDPCANKNNSLHLPHSYTAKDNGLKREWFANTFINPPFGRGVGEWIKKMAEESFKNEDNIYCMLLPARTDTLWFQESIWNDNISGRIALLHFIKGRLRFVNPFLNSKQEPHILGSMLWILGPYTYDHMRKLNFLIPGVSLRNEKIFATNCFHNFESEQEQDQQV